MDWRKDLLLQPQGPTTLRTSRRQRGNGVQSLAVDLQGAGRGVERLAAGCSEAAGEEQRVAVRVEVRQVERRVLAG